MKVLVIGRGEIGSALAKVINRTTPCTIPVSRNACDTYDIIDHPAIPSFLDTEYDVVHICFPYTPVFEKNVLEYIKRFNPKLVIIDSTVPPGTTRSICNNTKASVCYSPVLGRTADNMEWCLDTYEKFIGSVDVETGKLAEKHFKEIGLKTHLCKKPEDLEWAKILETSYWGLLVAWYQDLERIANNFDLDLNEIISFYANVQNVGKWPRPILWVGPIGGHCVISNARMLLQRYDSNFVGDIIRSHMAFEATMNSVVNVGERDDCLLCGRVYTRKIYRNESSEPFFIIQCLTCREPMIVFRNHTPNEKQVENAKKIAAGLFPDFKIDLEMRSIPQHIHFHMRKQNDNSDSC